ncbi:MAG: S-layer homology domain-containing protein [Gracilibacteraceae bacterium]|jgi:hypothetical protein|nr:S-layer homology domain-containing protein [Gracilibacteraceae bacterium]
MDTQNISKKAFAQLLLLSLLTAALTLILPPLSAAALDEAAPNYSDVRSSDWFYGDVAFVTARALMAPAAADKFGPDLPATRAMLVTALYRLAGFPATDGIYADLSAEAAAWAAKTGVTDDTGEGSFASDVSITREETATLIFNYARYAGATPGKEPALPDFADMDQVSVWALDGLRYCADTGVIPAGPGNLFDPQGESTRAELAAMLHRFVLAMEGEGVPAAPADPNPRTGLPFSPQDAAMAPLIGAAALAILNYLPRRFRP